MKTGASQIDIEDVSPSVLTRHNDGWVAYPHGNWRFLVPHTKTSATFAEIEIRLNSCENSSFPIEDQGYIKIIHLVSGENLKIHLRETIDNKITLHTHDCLLLGTEISFSLSADSVVGLDVTLLKNAQVKPELTHLVKYIPFEFQDEYEFLGNGAIQRFKVLVHPDMLDNQLSRCLFYVAPGENGPPFHTHPTFETFRMLDHSAPIEVAIGGEAPVETWLEPEDYLNVYPQVIHSFRNRSVKEAQFVATLCPAGAERTFIRFAQLYAQRKSDELNHEQYEEGMNKARREGCYISRALGAWK